VLLQEFRFYQSSILQHPLVNDGELRTERGRGKEEEEEGRKERGSERERERERERGSTLFDIEEPR
jgi:hypothetical protein